MAEEKDKTGKKLENQVADAYRRMGALEVEHDKRIAGHQIDVYVKLEATARRVHTVAVEAKDRKRPVGIGIITAFSAIVDRLRRKGLIDEGIIVSASGFSKEAREAIEDESIALLELADLEAMAKRAQVAGQARPAQPPVPRLPTPYFAHPYPLQENFTGRVQEREMLTQWMAGGQEPVFACIAIGGMGKSALTWAWLQRDVLGNELPGQPADPAGLADRCRVADADRPEGVLWWSFYEREASFAAFVDAALRYASAGAVDPDRIASLHHRTMALVGLLEQRRILLVLDGLERELRAYAGLNAAYQGDAVAKDPRGDYRACTDPHAGAFLGWLAAGPLAGHVLITSRLFPKELDGMAACRREDLTAFAPEDAVAFFQAQGVVGTRAEVQAACRPYGYLPLAMRLLAGVIVNDPEKPGDVSVATDYDVSRDLVPKHQHILKVAYDALDEDKRELLSRLAAFRSAMDYDAVAAVSQLDARRTKDAVKELVARGLLLFDRPAKRYDLHPIVRQYAYGRLTDKEGVHTSLRDYFDAVPKPDKGEVQSVEDLSPVIELYHHTVRAGRYDDALRLFHDRLTETLYFRFGAYQTCIELLLALFPDGDAKPPRLKEQSDQAWALNELANSYSLSGQPRRAVPLFEMQNGLREEADDKENLAIGLGNLAYMAQAHLGELAAADANLRRSIELCREIEDAPWEAVAHRELGRLLAYRGSFGESDGKLRIALDLFAKHGHAQCQGIVWAYRALRALLMREPRAALDAARRALRFWHQDAEEDYPVERDFVRAEWLLGWACVDLAAAETHRRDEHLTEAEGRLTDALTRCRRINMVDHEPDILLAWAKWHRLKREADLARQRAEDALRIADRCEYRLCQADIHNFLAQLALDAADRSAAGHHAETAHERAWCDGPPHCYKPALDQAEAVLKQLGLAPEHERG